MELLSRLDYYAIGRRYIVTRATKIEPGVIDTEGSDANLFVGATSYCAHATGQQVADGVNSLLLDGSEGENLDRLAWDRHTMYRQGAAAAMVTLTFVRQTAAAGAGSIPAGTRLVTLTGIEYVLTGAATFASTTTTTTADARAVQAGKEFQVGRNSITRFSQPSQIFDTTITVNNEEPAAGGEPVESDDKFKERIRDYWLAAQRGTLAAIAYGALTVPGVDSAEAVEVLDLSIPARIVELFVADSSGVANAALARLVDVALNEWRAAGIFVVTRTSVPELVGVQLALTFQSGVDTVTVGGNVRDAVVAFVNDLGTGRTLYRNDLGSVLARFRNQGLVPDDSSIVAPTGDVVPTAGRTLRTRTELVEVV